MALPSMPWSKAFFAALCAAALFATVNAEKLRLCVQEEEATPTVCKSMDRDDSPVICQRVVDSSNCAIDLAEGRADFGVFTADELMLAQHFYPSDFQVVAQLRNQDKASDDFEFETVAVVARGYRSSTNGSFSELIGSGFCHPGFSESQTWSDRVLKYFERKIMDNLCRSDLTLAENELLNLKEFFAKACRPGRWVRDAKLDRQLKNKYPQLCELCVRDCKYERPSDLHGHFGALDCLTKGRGRVAYVSLQRAKEYFEVGNAEASDYGLLCEDASTTRLDWSSACTWFKQPWRVVLARRDKAGEVGRRLGQLRGDSYASLTWQASLGKVLLGAGAAVAGVFENDTSIEHYLRAGGRDEQQALARPRGARRCADEELRWCAVGAAEASKCRWASVAASSLGIEPAISCVQARDHFDCFEKIAAGQATLAGIDSSYGYLARKAYGLAALLFAESLESQYSTVLAAVRQSSSQDSSSSSWRANGWAALRGRAACFPEYAGISWLSFVKLAREQRLIAAKSCDYPQLLTELLSGACAPGFSQASHWSSRLKPSQLGKLCSSCPAQAGGGCCEAGAQNAFFGDKGSLDCLMSGAGDVAFFESGNLRAWLDNGTLDASELRVLCKNGSLAAQPGLQVDQQCALSVTIDSELVSRRDLPERQVLDATSALLNMENWLGYRERKLLLLYGRFNATENLLFKDSTLSLVPTDHSGRGVQAYKQLFQHVDACSSAAVLAYSALAYCLALLLSLPLHR